VPSTLSLCFKIPISFTILLFLSTSEAQTISFLVYFGLYLLLSTLMPYRRKIYKWTIFFCCLALVLNAVLAVLV
jgi:hypothetical protein